MKKWMIVYERYCKAVEKVCAAIAPYLDYVPVCSQQENDEYNPIRLRTDSATEGFKIEVSEAEGECQQVTLTAQDEVNLYYAAADFQNIYIPYALDAERHQAPYYFFDIFATPLKPYCRAEKPHIQDRGIWLWGYTIYDYRRFIENMANLKLNTLIIWNDHLPVNIREVIAYAHEYGVKVYLGFAWGWEAGPIPDISRWDLIAEDVINTYQTQYADLPCDGIYFQSFTEHKHDMLNGMIVADAVVSMVNFIGEKLMAQKPDLKLLFGLHFSSVKNRLDYIAKVDSRISIIWEDVGAFPYAYMPAQVENFDQTVALNEQLQNLRPTGFGAVLKGVTALDWTTFKHLGGTYILGRSDRHYVQARLRKQRNILKYIQAWWIRNAKYAHKMIRGMRGDSMITCLVEDGLFEEAVNFPTALYAAMLWNSERDTDEILYETAVRPDVDMI